VAERGEDGEWIATLTTEHPNLRAALASGLRDAPEEALRLVTALHRFWLDGGHLVEGHRWCDQALAARPRRDGLRARALTVAGSIEFRRGVHEGRLGRYEELLGVERERDSAADLGRALLLNAMSTWMTMDWDRTLSLCDEAAACGDPLVEASARHIEALTHWYRGAAGESRTALARAAELLAGLADDTEPAFLVLLIGLPVVHDFGRPRIVHEETLATFRHCGPRQAEGYLRIAEAQFARFEGDHARACDLADDAVSRFRALGDRRGTALALGTASCVARSRGDLDRARSLLAESIDLRRAVGDTRLIGIGHGLEVLIDAVAGEPGRARARSVELEERFARQADTPALAGVLGNRGAFELAQGELETARGLLERSKSAQQVQRLRRSIAWIDIALVETLVALDDEGPAQTLLEQVTAEMERLGEPGGSEACAALEERLQSPLSSG
jgi:hypothetical protein